MRQGKFIDEVYRRVCEMPDDDRYPLLHLLIIAGTVRAEHPMWHAVFVVRKAFTRGWRWVISKTWFARSKRRGDSNANGAGT